MKAHHEAITTTEYAFTALFEPTRDGGYVVTFPLIRNLATQGQSLNEARQKAADCFRSYLQARLQDRLPLPESEPPRQRAISSLVTVSLNAA
jgi:predicted RNase H-like HicB family nuclease